MRKEHRILKGLAGAVFFIYLAFLFYLLLFSARYRSIELPEGFTRMNLVPFFEIRRIISGIDSLGIVYVIRNICGNAVGFIPFGLLLPVVFSKENRWWKVLLTGFAFSLMIETLQYRFRVGVFDIDDMMLNSLGTIIGYVIYKILSKIFSGENGK